MSTCYLSQGDVGQPGSPGAPGRIGAVGGQVCATYKLLCTLVEMISERFSEHTFLGQLCSKLEHLFRELVFRESEGFFLKIWKASCEDTACDCM